MATVTETVMAALAQTWTNLGDQEACAREERVSTSCGRGRVEDARGSSSLRAREKESVSALRDREDKESMRTHR